MAVPACPPLSPTGPASNLPLKVTEWDLRVLFARYGEIYSLRVLKFPNTGVCAGRLDIS